MPVAKELAETSLIFLVHPTLTPAHMEAACRAVEAVMGRAGR